MSGFQPTMWSKQGPDTYDADNWETEIEYAQNPDGDIDENDEQKAHKVVHTSILSCFSYFKSITHYY